MKRYFIILIALIVLCALPVFAGTPTPENAPAASEEDAWLWLNSLSEEELIKILGERVVFENSVPIVGCTSQKDSENLTWKDITIIYGKDGYVIMDWNGIIITDINKDGSITEADLAIILCQYMNWDGLDAIHYAKAVFCSLPYQQEIFSQK